MVSVEQLRMEFGGRVLWKDVSFVLQAGDRVALVGPNGAGKSTLLKALAEKHQADGGRIVKAKQLRLGYLAQEGVELRGRSLWDEVELGAFGEIRSWQVRYDELGESLETLETEGEEHAQVLEEMGELQLKLEGADLGQVRPRMETVLRGLGFSREDFERECGEFSGGWQMRIALAKLLLAEPDLLLLDEPTNHLDFDSQRWLEKYLRSWKGALVLISHDRAFLDALVKRTVALGYGRADVYAGNYSFFEREAKARREQLLQAKAAQEREIAKTQAFIDRFRAQANKASQVQSRIKQLAKIERIEVEEELSEIGFRFPDPPHSGQVTLEVEEARQQYGDLIVFDEVTLRVERGQKVAIVGVNGAGKSTFSRMIAGREQPKSGEVKYAKGVEISYYSQDSAEELDVSLDVLTTIERAMPMRANLNPRTVLAAFLFQGDDVFKSVSVLSGGERSRLALAKMLLQPANLLILDEPTNHLDLASQEMLAKALVEYPGTCLIVSHNRAFLDPVVTQVFEFRLGDKPLVFPGSLSDFLEKKEADERNASAQSAQTEVEGGARGAKAATASTQESKVESKAKGKEARQERARLRQLRQQKLKPLEEKVAKVEGAIATLEQEKARLSAYLADPSQQESKEAVALAAKNFGETEAALSKLYSMWDNLSEDLLSLEAELEL